MEDGSRALEIMALNDDFWRGRRVLLTGHTGFKGAWLALWLERLEAQVTAVALPPNTDPSLFEVLAPWPHMGTLLGDLRDPEVAAGMLQQANPEIVFHLAAQALVRPSYADPLGTFATNVLGTANLLEALRHSATVRAIVVVTSDKVYANDDRGRPFGEDSPLGGHDPYSASKACQEIVTACYRNSFYTSGFTKIGTARAGNVIGGGDWAKDRLIPDFVRAVGLGNAVEIRYPNATRPWQHVLEPLSGYLSFAQALCAAENEVPGALNFGPPLDEVRSVRWVIEQLIARWGNGARWRTNTLQQPSEAIALTLDPSLAFRSLGWYPRLSLEKAFDWTVDWYRAHRSGHDMRAYSLAEIARYEGLI